MMKEMTLQDLLMALGGVWYVVSAAISTMPPKGTQWSWGVMYDWMYDYLHLLLNQRHNLRAGAVSIDYEHLLKILPAQTVDALPKAQ